MAVSKVISKPAALAAGAAGGAAFRYAWRKADSGREVPKPQDPARSWKQVILAAALQGALFAVIHAAVDRFAGTKPTGTGDGAGRKAS